MKTYTLLLLITIIVLLYTCTENPITGNDNIPAGRRDYEWTVSVNPFQGAFFRSLWGSSPYDIWVCGDAIDSRMTLWHFNGSEWTPSNEYIVNPNHVFGFSTDDIWLGTGNSEIWHYDGSDWTLFQKLEYPGFADVVIERMWGKAPDDIYACGFANAIDNYEGIILHYDGLAWEYMNIEKLRVNFAEIFYDDNSRIFITHALNFDGLGTSDRVYTLNGNILKQIYAGKILTTISYIQGSVYIILFDVQNLDAKVYKYSAGGLKLWKDFTNTNFLGRMWGRSEADFFTETRKKGELRRGIGHYNGTDLITIYPIIDDWSTSDAIVFDSEVVILYQNQSDNTNHLLIGRLKN